MTSAIENTDSYKLSHWEQYPPEMTDISLYMESRGWDEPFIQEPEIVHFGLTYILENLNDFYWGDIDPAGDLITKHGFNFNRAGWTKLNRRYGRKMPLYIEALPEGSVVKPGTPQMQINATDPDFAWLPTYVETHVIRYHKTCAVATLSREIKKDILKALVISSDDPLGQIPFKLHDFGPRSDDLESIKRCGVAHLVNFLGTDNVPALRFARDYYHEDMAGFSIPAMEHSTVITWGEDREEAAYSNMIDKFGKPGKMFAAVSDSYDLANAVENMWCGSLKQKLLDSGATVVIRPDSGEPMLTTRTVCDIIANKVGYTKNSKGYKVLHPQFRIIHGDKINQKMIRNIMGNLMAYGYSIDNIAFGMGNELLHVPGRDSLKYAIKPNAVKYKGSEEWIPVRKKPKGAQFKWSKAGRIENAGIVPVYKNGEMLNSWTLKEIRENAKL